MKIRCFGGAIDAFSIAAMARLRTRSGSKPANAHTSLNCLFGDVSQRRACTVARSSAFADVASKIACRITACHSLRSCSNSSCDIIGRTPHALELACATSGMAMTPWVASCCGPRTAACRHGEESCGPPCWRRDRSRMRNGGSQEGQGTPSTRVATCRHSHVGAPMVDWHRGVPYARAHVGAGKGIARPKGPCDRSRICEVRYMASAGPQGSEAFPIERVGVGR